MIFEPVLQAPTTRDAREPIRPDIGPVRRWLEGLSVAAKLQMAISANALVPLTLAAGLLACVIFLGAEGTVKAKTSTAQLHMSHSALSLAKAQRHLSEFREKRSSQSLDAAKRSATQAELLMSLADSPRAEEILPGIKGQLTLFHDGVREVSAELKGLTRNASPLKLSRMEERIGALGADISVYSRALHKRTERSGKELIARVATAAQWSVFAAVLGAVVSVLMARTIIRNASGIIDQIVTATERLAAGQMDVQVPGSERGDELGAMARSLEVFRSASIALAELKERQTEDARLKLEQNVQIQDAERQSRAEKSELLNLLADDFELSVGEVIANVSEASSQLETTAKDMASHADGSAERSREVAKAVNFAMRRVTAAASATDQFALSINEITQQARDSSQLAKDSSCLAASANGKMDELRSAAHEVGGILSVIEEIASRTNLLALNASIEAARGQQAGRGFAVVASEVKALAAQTSEATSTVALKIAAMQASTDESVEELNAILTQIAKLEDASHAIASAVEQQSQAADDLAQNLDMLVSGSNIVVDQLDALEEASRMNRGAAADVLAGAQILGQNARSLHDKAHGFVGNVRSASLEIGQSEEINPAA